MDKNFDRRDLFFAKKTNMTTLIKEPQIQLKAFYDTEIENKFHLRKEFFLDSLRSPSGKQKLASIGLMEIEIILNNHTKF